MLDGGDKPDSPVGLRGFGNVLLWLVAIRAPDLVDSVYRAGRARRLSRYGQVDDHYVPSPALIGWLLAAAELSIRPDSRPDPDEDSASKNHSMRALVSRAFSGAPDEFRPEWFVTLAAQCGFMPADLVLVKRARHQVFDDNGDVIGVDPEAVRKAIETTRRQMPVPASPPSAPHRRANSQPAGDGRDSPGAGGVHRAGAARGAG